MVVNIFNKTITNESGTILKMKFLTLAPPPHPSLDLAGSREQRGSAFELYRKPQLGNVPVHHHNMR